ncbi:zinc finger and BTB domain-containing protein 17-like [Toxorhynchites rutilus septentrionalis]|uniref:zinc finger and BTB domain-containing protein 17-like n=1 Tax=Toxorhynchites rutilus septentrionalis TaxID=329112 RepID=UPI0024785D14|nr:zinc finger and BTB domain-containing protein 17-like [Toxorhynchites rutilus septentrionalis]
MLMYFNFINLIYKTKDLRNTHMASEQSALVSRDRFCRLCLSKSDSLLLPLLATIEREVSVMEMLEAVTGIELEVNPLYPTKICTNCLTKLDFAYGVRQEFLNSTELLLKLAVEDRLPTYYAKYESTKTSEEKISSADEVLKVSRDILETKIELQDIVVPNDMDITFNDVKNENDQDMTIEQNAESVEELEETTEILVPSDDKMLENECINSEKDTVKQEKFIYSWKDLVKPKRKNGIKSKSLLTGIDRKAKADAELLAQFPLTTCYICDTSHETLKHRDEHLNEHIDMVPHRCESCSSEAEPVISKSVLNLNRHRMMHLLPHKCDFCFRRFISTGSLYTHVWSMHMGDKEGHTCDYCGKRFNQRRSFQSHVRRHRYKANGTYKCEDCGETCGSRLLLARHRRKHTGERNFTCPYCSKKFSRACNLLMHKRIHTNERCHKCLECDKTFRDTVILRKHRERYHTGNNQCASNRNLFVLTEDGRKQFICKHEGCSYTTYNSTSISRHKASHTKRYECSDCGKRFSVPNLVRRHQVSMHSKGLKFCTNNVRISIMSSETKSKNTDASCVEDVKSKLDDFCRVCLLRKSPLLPLTSDLNGTMIPEMLWKVSGMLFNVLEQLPRVICERCMAKLDLAFSIAKEFREQEEKLRSFCWKGALVDQLALYQQSDESKNALYSDEVIRKLITSSRKKQTETGQDTEAEVHEFEVERLEEDHDDEQSLEPDYDSDGDSPPEQITAVILPGGSVEVKAEIEEGDDEEQSEVAPLPVTKIEVEEWIEEGGTVTRIRRRNTSETLEFSCDESIDSQDPIKYDEDDLYGESEEEVATSRKQTRKPKTPKRPIKSVLNADGKYECNDCGRIFGVQKTFLNHLRRHEHIKQGSFACTQCDKCFGTKDRLARHIELHNRDLTCKECGHESQNGYEFRTHRFSHQDGHYKCKRCIFSCDTKEQLKEHKLMNDCAVADEKRPYSKPATLKDKKCPYEGCEYTAETYGAMYVHKRAKHLQQFSCEICGKRFAFANQVRLHEKLHTGEKPYQCTVCSKSFRRMFSFKEHMAIHEGNESYVCDVCGKSFTRPRYLNAHLLTHSEERPFECAICESRYKTNGELTKHIRTKHQSQLDLSNSDLIVEEYDYYEEEYCA